MDKTNTQQRFVETPMGKGWLEAITQGNKYLVVITDPNKDVKFHKYARLVFYPEEIAELDNP